MIESESILSCSGLCILLSLLGIVLLLIKLIEIITTSYLIGIILIVMIIIWMLKNVGQFAMYPGSFSLVKSDIEIRGTSQIAQKLSKLSTEYY